MSMTRILTAAAAAAFLSTAVAYAVPPSASQVTVPPGTQSGQYEGKMRALFSSPEELMMFRVQLREATKGMNRDQKRAYRGQQFAKIRAMTNSEKASWRHGLDAQWAALPADRQQRMEARMQKQEERHEANAQNRQNNRYGQNMGGQDMDYGGAPQQQ
ncbi:MAG: hypothetical protein WDM89_10550 [Rhizomicrobium sp.]